MAQMVTILARWLTKSRPLLHAAIIATRSKPRKKMPPPVSARRLRWQHSIRFAKRGASLERTRHTVALGRLSYNLYLLSCLAAVLAISVPEGAGSITPGVLLKSIAILVYDLITGQWLPVLQGVKRLLTTPWVVVALLGTFGLSAA